MFKFLEKNPVLIKLFSFFYLVFANTSLIVAINLISLILSIFTLNSCKSIRFSFVHFLRYISVKTLNVYYYALKYCKIDISKWSIAIIKIALTLVPGGCTLPFFLAIDDTLVEKFGEHFEGVSSLFDHTSRNGTSYLHGHCFVCLIMIFPISVGGNFIYIRVPIGYRIWIPAKREKAKNTDKKQKKSKQKSLNAKANSEDEKTKLTIAAELLELAYSVLGSERTIVVLADSWYPKGSVRNFIKEHKNVAGIFNVRKDTALYDLPEKTGKRGRPDKYGKKISIDDDFEFIDVPETDFRIGYRKVVTHLFGGDIVCMAVVTEARDSGSKRLFLCTDPEKSTIDIRHITDPNVRAFGEAVKEVLCFCPYCFRWGIEVTFLEQKSHWGLGDYMLRSITGIERWINLQTVAYASLCLLYSDAK